MLDETPQFGADWRPRTAERPNAQTDRAPGNASRFAFFDTPFACFAHRGGFVDDEDRGKENTLYAFKRAVELGYRYLETDLHATRDGDLVAFHDHTLDRVTGRSGRIAELRTADLGVIKVAGSEPIALFSDLLEEFPDRFFNVDLKHSAAIAPLLRLLHQTQSHDRICVTSFSHRRLSAFRRLVDRPIATAFSVPEVALTKLASLWPRLMRTPAAALQIPVRTPLLGARVPVLSKRLIRVAHANDVRVQIWTVNDPAVMRNLMTMGVDGIMSDRISVLQDVAVEQRRWFGD